jgi:methyltransferase (TIGR00027 family)
MKPISNMAFYCCGVRANDAECANPVCGDGYAKWFMDDCAQRICDKFKDETFSGVSIIVRHRTIDDVLRKMLRLTPDLGVVIIGSGFDSRPYRLIGGAWFELDEPDVITYKNERLPISECSNPLRRIPIDFLADPLEDSLTRIDHMGPIIFLLEGIFIYLAESEIKSLLDLLRRLFPQHQLICDLVNRQMVETYGARLHEIVMGMGALFKPVDEPETVFLSAGYQVQQKISLLEASVELGMYEIPAFISKCFYDAEIQGNAVYVMKRNGPMAYSM